MSPKNETPREITDGADAEGAPSLGTAEAAANPAVAPAPAVEPAQQTVTTPTGEAVPMAIMKVVGIEDLERLFTYHKPDSTQVALIERVRMGGKDLATLITRSIPPCRERGIAITKIEEAIMWANAAIVRGGK